MQNTEILFEVLQGQYGDIGLVTLNRPHVLNALTEHMCIQLYEQLNAWTTLDHVKAVVVQGAGERAFCAGGDIRLAYEFQNDITRSEGFFAHEYCLNEFVYHYPKPYIALMDGITMGGGLGISAQARYRIATERSVFAMPETAIGFFPDVGGSYFLPRLKGKSGWYLGLTGQTIDTSSAIYAGLVDAQISSEDIPVFINELRKISWQGDVSVAMHALVARFQKVVSVSSLSQIEALIDNCFSADTVESILFNLQNDGSDEAKRIYDVLLSRSPTSLKVTLASLRRGEAMDFDACIKMNYDMACQFLRGHDFYEGVRAVLIDKDKNPRWRPASLSEVSDAEVFAYFAEYKDM